MEPLKHDWERWRLLVSGVIPALVGTLLPSTSLYLSPSVRELTTRVGGYEGAHVEANFEVMPHLLYQCLTSNRPIAAATSSPCCAPATDTWTAESASRAIHLFHMVEAGRVAGGVSWGPANGQYGSTRGDSPDFRVHSIVPVPWCMFAPVFPTPPFLLHFWYVGMRSRTIECKRTGQRSSLPAGSSTLLT